MQQKQRNRSYHNSYEEIIKAQLDLIKELSQELVKLSLEIARLKEPVPAVAMQVNRGPMHVPESEEDAKYLLETGQIDMDEFKSMLNELNFFNNEIVVPGA